MKKRKIISLIIIIVLILAIIFIVIHKNNMNNDNVPSAGTSTVEGLENTQEPSLSDAEISKNDIITENQQQKIEVSTQDKEASYEEWLAAGIMVAITMKYPEFNFTEIYLASETTLNDYDESQGVYVCFMCEGDEIAIHSKPLEGERKESGSIDVYTATLGYATFDQVDIKSFDTKTMKAIKADDLSELISKSMLVSLYER